MNVLFYPIEQGMKFEDGDLDNTPVSMNITLASLNISQVSLNSVQVNLFTVRVR